MKTTATTEAVSSSPKENEHRNTKWRRNTAGAGQKPRADWKNELQIQGAGRKSRKLPALFLGIKPYGKSQHTCRFGFARQTAVNQFGGEVKVISKFKAWQRLAVTGIQSIWSAEHEIQT
jgi:hypothetical protein